MNSIEKALAAAVEPLVDDIISLEKRVDAISVKDGVGIKAIEIGQDNKSADFILDNDQVVTIDLPEGPAGKVGEKGIDGKDGVGLDCPVWGERIYRQGDRVQHNIGQYFEAKADTAGEPGISDDWERLGTAGMRFCGGFKKDATYIDGDVYVKDYCTFLVVKGESKMLAKVGGKGDRGEPGKDADNELVAKYLLSSPDFSEQLKRVSNGVDDFVINDDGFAIITRSGDVHSWTLPAALKQFLNMTSALAEDEQPPITRFVGSWDGGESYTRGDVVQYGQGVYVCYKSGKSNVLLEHFICLMTISFAGGGGGGGGGVGPAGPAGPQGEPGVDGKDGIDGKSAYEIAVDGGFVGTEQQWLDSLVGADGDSAYEVAVAGGYVGTEAEWIASLKGEQGMGLRYVGRVATAADLAAIVDPVHGDIYIAEDTGNAYVWNSVASSWDDAGPVVGAEGPIGPQGEPGPTAVSADADNGAYLGTDNLVYVPKADGVYLPLAGGTMTGTIKVPNGINAFQTASNFNMTGNVAGLYYRFGTSNLFHYGVNAHQSFKPLILPSPPTDPKHAATKEYVDSVAGSATGDYLPLAGGTMTGTINFPIAGVGTGNAMQWPGTLAPAILADDGTWYFDVGSDNAFYIEKTRIGFSIPVELKADPIAPLGAATKQYVDAKVGGGSSYTLPPAGATTLGGVFSKTAPTGSYVTGIDATGTPTFGAPTIPPAYTLPVATDTILGGIKVGTKSANEYVNGVAADGTLQWGTVSSTGAPLRMPPTDVSSFNGVDSYWYMGSNGTVRLQMPGSTTGIFIASDGRQTFQKAPICNPAPTDPKHLTNKEYVDAQVAAGGGSTSGLPLTGGTMTGTITLPTTIQSLLWGTSTYNMFGASGGVAIRFGNANIVNFTSTGATYTQKITTSGTGIGVEFGSSGGYLSKVGTGIGAYIGGALRWSFSATEHASTIPIAVSAPATASNHLVTKSYVDAKPAIIPMVAGSAEPDAALYPNGTLLVTY